MNRRMAVVGAVTTLMVFGLAGPLSAQDRPMANGNLLDEGLPGLAKTRASAGP